MTNAEIKNIIAKYNIHVIGEGLSFDKMYASHIEEIKAVKPEIIEYVKAEEEAIIKAAQERKAKIEAIDGIKEIENLENEWRNYNSAFARMMNTGSSVMGVSCPITKVKDLLTKYPRAAAYRMAQNYSNASNYAKSAAGDEALEKIINGENHETAITEMENQWTGYCDKNVD